MRHDYRRGFIKVPSHESDLPGHVYSAVDVAADHGIHHPLDDVGRLVSPKVRADYLLGRALASPTFERAKHVFNDMIKSAFDPDLVPRELETVSATAQYAERQFAKVMNVQRGVIIDFSLAAEPTRFEATLPEVCSESERCKEAMGDEIVSMTEKLKIYQADLKAAFLQAPLDEKIFVKAPPGYDSVDPNTREQIVWELSKSVYGLKQSSACFWSAMDEHLRANGFESMLGGPSLFRKKFPGGKVIFGCHLYR